MSLHESLISQLESVISIFHSLEHRNFRLYYLGQLVSLNGTWMQNVAQAWLVYRLTDSSLMLGLVAFFGLSPVLLFSLFGGVIADRHNRRRILILAHSVALLQALTLATLTLSGRVEYWHVMVLSILLGIVHALEMPARHSFIADMVPREDLANAIALNSSAFNIARFMGPFLAGVLVAHFGEGQVFLINAISFLAVLTGLLRMNITSKATGRAAGSTISHIREGFNYAWHRLEIRTGLIHLAVFSLVGSSMTVLMPVFVNRVYHGDSRLLGMLLGCMGAGALIGAFTLAYFSGFRHLEKRIGLAGVIAGLCLVSMSQVHHVYLAFPVLVVFGFCQNMLAASTNTLVQSTLEDRLRGRVMSIFSMVFIGMMPIGSILAGTVAEWIRVANTVLLLGSACIVASTVFLFSIYRRKIER